jgi:hypothetical protein
MKVVLKNVNGESITIDVKPEDTFHDLKTKIHNESGIQLDLEQLNFKGKKITDDQIVAEYFFDGLYEFPYMYFSYYLHLLCDFFRL